MFAIVDVSHRASRGKILVIVDDRAAATEVVAEMNRRGQVVNFHSITPRQLDQVQDDVRAGSFAPRIRAIA